MISPNKQKELMELVLQEVEIAIREGNNPFAAILVGKNGNVVIKAHNSQNTIDRTCHAEVVLIRKACKKLKKFYFKDYYVFTNSEPCSMCMSLLIKAKIKGIFFGAPLDKGNDPYIRAEEMNKKAKHKLTIVGGILKEKCKNIIQNQRNEKF